MYSQLISLKNYPTIDITFIACPSQTIKTERWWSNWGYCKYNKGGWDKTLFPAPVYATSKWEIFSISSMLNQGSWDSPDEWIIFIRPACSVLGIGTQDRFKRLNGARKN